MPSRQWSFANAAERPRRVGEPVFEKREEARKKVTVDWMFHKMFKSDRRSPGNPVLPWR